jgi:hypothetical protein
LSPLRSYEANKVKTIISAEKGRRLKNQRYALKKAEEAKAEAEREAALRKRKKAKAAAEAAAPN